MYKKWANIFKYSDIWIYYTSAIIYCVTFMWKLKLQPKKKFICNQKNLRAQTITFILGAIGPLNSNLP